jgi:streptomycin 3"-adenylyltransferase
MLVVEPVIQKLKGHLQRTDPGGVLAVHLFGSSAVGGLRPSSDIDVLMLTRRSLSRLDRERLAAFLLRFSGRRATVAPGRPLEVTSVVLDDVVPWRYPPVCDFLYGEWLRDDFLAGAIPEPHTNPDLAVLVTTVRQHAIPVLGPHPVDLLEPVPVEDLRRSVHDSLDPLLEDLVGDERNVLLTLARMVVTLESGPIVGKDEAVHQILLSLGEPHRSLLALAAGGYLGSVADAWTDRRHEAAATAEHLAERIRARGRANP